MPYDVLPFDAPVEFDSPDYTLDGLYVGPPVPVSVGGGRPMYFVPNRVVGYAYAELGSLEAHAKAVITRVGVARCNIRIVALASEGEKGWRLRRLQRERDDLELLWLLDMADDVLFVMLDDVEVEIERLEGAFGEGNPK
ncbi:MAG: hypothetical protein M3Q30_26315 [Actinomycetota bacterium]|nr:hypothetical protein [Actinomycetota bacterium]